MEKKYIDAEKLIAEIKRQKHELELSIQSQGDYGQSCHIVAYDNILSLIDSLQQEQPESELTEFEKSLADVIGYAISQSVVEPNYETYKFVKDWSKRLLDAAKKDLCKGCAANLEGYIKGRQDALKEVEENRVYKYEGPTIPTHILSCPYNTGGCTNPMRDCINCPSYPITGISTNTGTSTAKEEG